MQALHNRVLDIERTNTVLKNRNEQLQRQNHELKMRNQVLEDHSAAKQAVLTARLQTMQFEHYSKTLEDENKSLRKQLACLVENQKIDKQIAAMKKMVEETENELEKRLNMMEKTKELEKDLKARLTLD